MQRREAPEAPRQEIVSETVRRTHAHRAAQAFACARNQRSGLQQFGLDPLGAPHQHLARRCENAAIGLPVHESCADLGLEGGQLAAYGGVVQAQIASRAKDLAGARHGEEDADAIPVHGSDYNLCTTNLQFLSLMCEI